MVTWLWLHIEILWIRRRIAVDERGALSTEAVVITAALAALAIVVVAIITLNVSSRKDLRYSGAGA